MYVLVMRPLVLVVGCVTASGSLPAGADLLAAYNSYQVSGNAPQWNGSGSTHSIPTPATRGAGLALGTGRHQFAARGVTTSQALSFADEDYVRFGLQLSQSAGSAYAVTEFRAICGSLGAGSGGIQYQIWGFLPGQAPFPLHAAASMGLAGSRVEVALTELPANTVLLTGESAEFRMYCWGASQTENAVAFFDGNADVPDVVISGWAVPAPGQFALAAAGGAVLSSRRRRRGVRSGA